ncbi:MAG: type VI secretion system baseplate subunit TssG [Desulfovibrionales bacterium]|nr:type VI secretion system baseplate subunit TssG [Desulfovibrionales bacterium]
MATNERKPAPPLVQLLADEPWRFDFWQAVYILQRLTHKDVGADSPLGEAIEFTSNTSFAFPPSDIDGVFISPLQSMLRVTFMGLAGAHGPLPYHMTEEMLTLSKDKERAFEDFINLFNHRLITLFYKAVTKLRPTNAAAPHPSQSPFAQYLFAIAGMGTPALRSDDPMKDGLAGVPDCALLPFAALLGTYPRSAAGLEQIITGHYGIPARVDSFTGEWLTIEPEDQTHIGTLGRNRELGENAVIGTQCWDQCAGFTLHLGPLSAHDYMRFLPEPAGKDRAALLKLVSFYAGTTLTCNISLELDEGEHLDMYLGKNGTAWLGWIPGSPPEQFAV